MTFKNQRFFAKVEIRFGWLMQDEHEQILLANAYSPIDKVYTGKLKELQCEETTKESAKR